jgi:ethanolamine transporter EutH
LRTDLWLTNLLSGFALSFGIFQNYYANLPEFANNPYIPIVGSIATGISYLGAPFMTPFVKRFPRHQRTMIWVGWVMCLGGLAAGSFVRTLGGLIITQGIMYGGMWPTS